MLVYNKYLLINMHSMNIKINLYTIYFGNLIFPLLKFLSTAHYTITVLHTYIMDLGTVFVYHCV